MTCALCGWPRHAGIHSPIVEGPRKGQPWGHTYIDRELNYPKPPPDPKPGDFELGDVPSPTSGATK